LSLTGGGQRSQAEVVACDLEGTLTTAETWRAIATRLKATERERRYRNFVLRRLPRVLAVRLSLIDRQRFRDAWITDFAGLLRGFSESEMEALAERIVEDELWPQRRTAVVGELEAHRAAGRVVMLCSGTYQAVLDAFARRLDAEALGTPLEARDGELTGRLLEPPNTGARKAARLRTALGGRPLHAAYGDSLADTEMMEASREPVAVQPEAGLRRLAASRGWRVLEAEAG
jgi:HAD superfamily phosphoserine phosphatase-like hydrolase